MTDAPPQGMLAVYPGAFDPVTFGHLEIIRRAHRLFPRLVVAVSRSDDKQPTFPHAERAELLRLALEETGGELASVEVAMFDGLLVNFCRERGARMAIRGMRAVSDFEAEFQMAWTNARLDSELETMFLVASEQSHFISSRIVKEVARLGGPLESFAPAVVAERLRRRLATPSS